MPIRLRVENGDSALVCDCRGYALARVGYGYKNAIASVPLAFGERGRSLFRTEKVFSKSIDKTPLALL